MTRMFYLLACSFRFANITSVYEKICNKKPKETITGPTHFIGVKLLMDMAQHTNTNLWLRWKMVPGKSTLRIPARMNNAIHHI